MATAYAKKHKPIVAKSKIRTGDTVQVVTGKDAGRRGKVIRVLPEEGRLLVEQVNVVKRHTKPRPPANPQQASRQQPTGGVIEKEAPVQISNVQIVCPGCDKPSRVGYRITEDGNKVRVCRNEGCRADIESK